jgi:hypothetical protein
VAVVRHPLVGELELHDEKRKRPDERQTPVTSTARPGSRSATALRILPRPAQPK